VAKVAALPTDAAPAAAPVSKPSGLGYVAVLASVPASGTSRITALQQYADLQQRYAGILQNKTPDVTEANLGEKGRYHRLVVGPPGSKDGANSVCSQLKTAGYASCWVMAY
jgi:cell division septation protein DedD